MGDIKQRKIGSAFLNAKWLVIASIGKVLIQAIGLAMIARLLNPIDFGLMAMVTVITNFAGLLRDFSTGYYVVQRKEISEKFLSSVFLFNIIVGFFVGAIVYLTGDLAADFFKESALSSIFKTIAITFPLTALGSIHQALLERNSNFKYIAVIELISYSIGLFVAIIAALYNYGVYSLVYQAIANSLIASILFINSSKWKPGLILKKTYLKEILSFSGFLTLFNFISTSSKSLDSIFFGRVLGSKILGEYNLASKLVNYPLQVTAMISSRAIMPILSELQDNIPEFNRQHNQALSFTCFIGFPLLGVTWVARDELIAIAFGDKWIAAANFVPWLVLVAAVQLITSTSLAVLTSKGMTKELVKMIAITCTVQLICYATFFNVGTIGLLSAYLLSSIFSGIYTLYILSNALDTKILTILKNCIYPIINTIIVTVLSCFFHSTLLEHDFNKFTLLIMVTVFQLATYLYLSFKCDNFNFKKIIGIVFFKLNIKKY